MCMPHISWYFCLESFYEILLAKVDTQYCLDIPSVYCLLMLPSSNVFLTIIKYKYYYMIHTQCFITVLQKFIPVVIPS